MRNSFSSSNMFQAQPTVTSPGLNSFGYYKACSSDGRFCVICNTYYEEAQHRWVRMCWHFRDGSYTGADGTYL
jgi:hypothetical protein